MTGRKSIKKDNGGYTLLEVLIALFLFIAVAVPMIAAVFTNTGALRCQESLIAQWLLEQEAAKIQYFPEDVAPVKHRVVLGNDWTIAVKPEGSGLVTYNLTASSHNKKHGSLVVYGYRK